MLYQFNPENLKQQFELTLPNQLRYLREKNGLTQQELADALCIERSTYTYYEKGVHPSLPILMSLALLYDVTTDFLLGFPEEPREPNAFERELLALVKRYFP